MDADQIAKKLSNSSACGFWLTRRQVDWLFSTYNREVDSRGWQKQIAGSFEVDGRRFNWEANIAPNGAACFKVSEIEGVRNETKLVAWLAERGYDYWEVMSDPELALELLTRYRAEEAA